MYRLICLSVLGLLSALPAVGCGAPGGAADRPSAPAIESLAEPLTEPEVRPADIRTVGSEDLARVREQHAGLIASIPTPTPFPTRPPSEVASVYVLTGEDVSPEAGLDSLVSDPGLGIWWFRSSGGDWTTRRHRDLNPYSPLFYSSEYGPEHPSFHDGGMQELVAQQLAQGAERLLPEIRGRGAGLVSPLASNLGWELASAELPVVRVWSSFTYLGPVDDGPREYRVGGVLAFGVQDHLDPVSGNVIYQYLVMDRFLGSGIIVEDAGPLVADRPQRR